MHTLESLSLFLTSLRCAELAKGELVPDYLQGFFWVF
jgi:hypothetical protein